MSKTNIPVHDFSKDDSSSIPFRLEQLTQRKSYDVRTPHRHNYYEIFLFTKGSGDHMIDFESVPITPNCVHFLSPGQVHLLRRSLDSEGFVIYFSRDFYSLNLQDKDLLLTLPFLNSHDGPIPLTVPRQKFEHILQLVGMMQAQYEDSADLKKESLRSWLNLLLIEFHRVYNDLYQVGKEEQDSTKHHIDRFMVLVEKNFIKYHLVQEYASELALSPSHLNDLCKKKLGKTASSIIHERIALEAKRLLFHTELSAKEIAFFLNFEDPSYFSRFFRKKVNCSPSEFRKKVRALN